MIASMCLISPSRTLKTSQAGMLFGPMNGARPCQPRTFPGWSKKNRTMTSPRDGSVRYMPRSRAAAMCRVTPSRTCCATPIAVAGLGARPGSSPSARSTVWTPFSIRGQSSATGIRPASPEDTPSR